MNKTIPRSFWLMGHQITVQVVPEKDWTNEDAVGLWATAKCEMLIRGDRAEQIQQQVFCHELVHAILEKMGEDKLCGDEQFVDVFGSLLHQAWTSAKYDSAAAPAKKKAG